MRGSASSGHRRPPGSRRQPATAIPRARRLTALAVLGLAASLAVPGSAQDLDPWQLLDRLRADLTEGSPLAFEFSQTFTPAGFSSGDTETGVLSLQLPECARWDYSEPFPRSYLLCGTVAYSWNPGESSGRRFEILPDERAGLDLLRLDVVELKRQYDASAGSIPAGLEIRLRPADSASEIAGATLLLSADGRRLVSLGFDDSEGSRTLFELGESLPASGHDLFEPPPDVEWLED